MAWFLSLYTHSGNEYKLIDYTACETYEDAEQLLKKSVPQYKSDLYRVESVLGGLDDSVKGVFHCRKTYAHSAKVAEQQRKAEAEAKKLLKSIRNLTPKSSINHIQDIMQTAIVLKMFLTVEQYDVLLVEMERQPIIRKLQEATK